MAASVSVTVVSSAKITYSLVAIEKRGSLNWPSPTDSRIQSCASDSAVKMLKSRLRYQTVFEAPA